MSRLAARDFGPFFAAVHGCAPFPWQERLLELVLEKGWPEALDVPTGAGKTAAIDVAVFHLALEAHRGDKRMAPVRVLFVVDRRLVVDDAFERARLLASRLVSPPSRVVERVAQQLGLLAEDPARPLVVARLRGGAPKEPDWVRTPAQPAVVVSTVDQVGSRLLFRGYGVSQSMRPIHAGLLGIDSLLLLDEAHLSQPFVQTARDARQYQEDSGKQRLAVAPFRVVTLSATQTDRAPRLVKSDDEKHRVLGPRLLRSKPAQLIEVAREEDLVPTLTEHAVALSAHGGGTAAVVAVVVNRVRRARLVYRALMDRSRTDEEPAADVALLIGRSRALERDEKVAELRPRIAAQREHQPNSKPLFVVATQCIEAGADLDFDALVTEVAPLDSLRQRFGRLNRMGRLDQAPAVIVAARDTLGARAKPDPVYGTASAATWAWLSSKATSTKAGRTLDFGVRASSRWLPEGEQLRSCLAPRANAPLLMPAFVDRWNMTSPASAADPDIALFLHGPQAGPADVQLAWRADMVPSPEALDVCRERLAVCPPSSLETIALPIWELVAWLGGKADGDVHDTEAMAQPEELDRRQRRTRPALRWRGADDEGTTFVSASQIRPGDTLVVPSDWGGCDEWGWNPHERSPVRDLGSRANLQQRGRDVLRLSEGVFRDELRAIAASGRTTASVGGSSELGEGAIDARVRGWAGLIGALRESSDTEILEALRRAPHLPPEHARWVEGLQSRSRVRIARAADGAPIAIERRAPHVAAGEPVTEDDASSNAMAAVELEAHCAGVAELAERVARQLGLPDSVIKDVRTAAYLHDSGKAHPAFKRWLYAGDELAAIAGPALAKSGRLNLGRRARESAGLPVGARHELASLAFAWSHPLLAASSDPELVLWLIGTHHGWGRPFFPAVDWPGASTVFEARLGGAGARSSPARSLAELTAVWLVLQESLTVRYGLWGLARLEAVVRLADHRRSELEQDGAS